MTASPSKRNPATQCRNNKNRQASAVQFTKLRLLGFKSFVDPTELEIGNGLTGVVGPNGCGKSNLLEALRWVMGENRPTAMRGSGMEDVIFNGAASRPARAYAEVTLSLDNSLRVAPPAFNDTDKIDVVRRITRDAGSAYRVTGKDARARDVQMLFADASTGAHSPSLVRQGQISELVNAKPQARRRVLEEAAGISGLYARRHEAELKLNGTETNLSRVEDVLDGLGSQLSLLARQAKQASRYREIADALRTSEAVLLYRRWAEAEAARHDADIALSAASKAAAGLQSEAARTAKAREEASTAMPPLREEATVAAAVLQRLLVERDQLDAAETRAKDAIATLAARMEQLRSDMEREAALGSDADSTIKRLDWETGELEKAGTDYEARDAAARAKASQSAADLGEHEAALDTATEDLARAEAKAQSLERRHDDAAEAVARATEEAGAAEAAVTTTQASIAAASAALATAKATSQSAADAAVAAESSVLDAEAARAEAQSQEAECRAAMSERDGEAKALRAEAEALERLISRDRTRDGQLIDRVKVKAGHEAALGAALGDELKAGERDGSASGWTHLQRYPDTADLPAGAIALASVVDVPDVLNRRLAAIGLVDRADGDRLQAALQPGQRLVSREGDLWRWDGYVLRADDAASNAAALLKQRNRLAEIKETLTGAEAQLDTARQAHAKAQGQLETATTGEKASREARRVAEAAANDAVRALNQSEAEIATLKGRMETQSQTLIRRHEEAAGSSQVLAETKAAMAELSDLEPARMALEKLKTDVEAARANMLDARSQADEVRRNETGRAKRLEEVEREAASWRARQSSASQRVGEFEARIAETDGKLAEAKAAPDLVADKRGALANQIDSAEARRKAADDAMAEGEMALRAAETAEREAERSASEAREARARAEATAEGRRAAVDDAAARIREDTDGTPEELLEKNQIDPDEMPDAEKAELDVARLKRQRDALGAVNLRAEEDAREVQSEYDELAGERDDLIAAVEKLKGGIQSLNREGRQRLLDAFDQVNRNFRTLFTHLFDGGDANLVLVESDDPLEAGLEIMCQPPGKKLATLSLLSGGEQTLTALALIFAVFLANPSPICVLDEVDAPLDDSNVTRFCDLLDRMTKETETRFLIITHHAITMSRMDRLFGVTMAEQGVSQLVSVDLKKAEELVDA